MSAHARFPVDPAARIAPDKLDLLADAADDPEWRRALRQAARDARTLAALRKRVEEHKADAVRIINGQYSEDAKLANTGLHSAFRAVLAWLDDLETRP